MVSFELIDARLSSMEKILTEIKVNPKPEEINGSDDATMEEAEKILILRRERIYAIQKQFTVKKQGKRLLFSKKELWAYRNSNIKNRKEE